MQELFSSRPANDTNPSWKWHLHFMTVLSQWIISYRFKRILSCRLNVTVSFWKAAQWGMMCGCNIYCLPAPLHKDKNLQLQRLIGRSSALLVLCPPEMPWLPHRRAQSGVRSCHAQPWCGLMKREEPHYLPSLWADDFKKHTVFQKKDPHSEMFMKCL